MIGNHLGFLIGLGSKSLTKFVASELVVARDMPNPGPSEQRIAILHLVDGPSQNRFGLAHVGHDGVHQVRQSRIAAEFDHLRVDHQHAHFVRSSCHQDRTDDGVQANAFSRAGSTRDKQVR